MCTIQLVEEAVYCCMPPNHLSHFTSVFMNPLVNQLPHQKLATIDRKFESFSQARFGLALGGRLITTEQQRLGREQPE